MFQTDNGARLPVLCMQKLNHHFAGFLLVGLAAQGISTMMYYYIQAFLESAAHVCKEDGQLATGPNRSICLPRGQAHFNR